MQLVCGAITLLHIWTLDKRHHPGTGDNSPMAQVFDIHPDNPQPRLIQRAVAILHQGGIAAIPTDSSYALVCHLDDKDAADRLRHIRGLDHKHHLTLLCSDLSELATYARVDNRQFRLLKLGTPGPYTFILEATKEVPKRVSTPSKRTIGLRVPDHIICQTLLSALGQPLLATTLIPPNETEPLNEVEAIKDAMGRDIDTVINAGSCCMTPTTVIDLSQATVSVVRQGGGSLETLGLQ